MPSCHDYCAITLHSTVSESGSTTKSLGDLQMERRARLRKIMATMDEEDERRAALPGKNIGPPPCST